MLSRWLAYHWRVRRLGIGLLILSLGHTPLPKADYHNIRHHDEPGEVCRFHDHLIRWHPDANLAEDIPVLHWHWFLPTQGMPDTLPFGQEAGVHSSVPDWSGLAWDDGPHFVPDVRSRLIGRPSSDPLMAYLPSLDVSAAMPARAGPSRPIHSFGATFPPRISLTSLLQRQMC